MKIAIIGAGIGGSSLAYYMRGNDTTIYEAGNEPGGRISNVSIDGKIIETGAEFFHTVNQNIVKLVDDLNIEKEEFNLNESFGLWDGDQMVYKTSNSTILSTLQLLLRFGFKLFKLQSLIKQGKKNLAKFYESDKSFETIPELIKLIGFENIYQDSFDKNLKNFGVSDKIIKELVLPVTRYIYHESGIPSINGFAGFVTMVATDDDPIYYLKEGNKVICKKLIEKSEAIISYEDPVNKIVKKDNKYEVNSKTGVKVFDTVIICAPLEISNIEFEGIEVQDQNKRIYNPYILTIVGGKINSKFFGKKSVPDLIFSNKSKIFGLAKILKRENDEIWSISHSEELSDNLLDDMFLNRNFTETHRFSYAYPNLDPVDNFAPIILADNLFYLSGIDSLSPTMETSIIMSRNISKLIKTSTLK
ncbi:MAG: FAD-dependent oxidoreductase [Candidatus Kariarchaeaceae archaeon]|jgi:prenylcysteine oxidase/farnesylcysteine lyase